MTRLDEYAEAGLGELAKAVSHACGVYSTKFESVSIEWISLVRITPWGTIGGPPDPVRYVDIHVRAVIDGELMSGWIRYDLQTAEMTERDWLPVPGMAE